MLLVEYYHRLCTEWDNGRGEISVTLEELSGILYCSERNVKLILKKMADAAWIRWIPGRGRGNRSQLSLLADSGELLLEEARRHVQDGQVKSAMELMNLRGLPQALKEEFLEWLSGYFGYQETGDREKRMDTLRLPAYSPILTLDPAEMLFARDLHLVKQIFDTLTRFDPKDRTFKPQLAHYWESDPTGIVWTFQLRKGIRFHHGRELTSEDVVYTMLRLKRRVAASNGWLAQRIVRAEAAGPLTVRVELESPNYMFLHYVSAAGMSILPKDVYESAEEGGGRLDRYPIGTGPFRVTRHDDCVCVLDAFSDYFLDRAHLDRVEVWTMPGECAPGPEVRTDLEAADISAAGTPYRSERTMQPGGAAVGVDCSRAITKLEQGSILLTFNMQRPGPQRSRAFREAVHRLLDREAMARELGPGKLFPAQGFLPPDPLPLTDDSFSLEQGLRLLREGGYDGEPLRIRMTSKHEPKGRFIARELAKGGIPVQLDFMTKHEAGSMDRLLEAQCFLGGVVADEDLDLALLEMYQVANMPIRHYFTPEVYEELGRRIEGILREPSARERPQRLRELEETLKRDHYVVFLLHPISLTSYSPVINGVSLNSLGMVNFKDLWFQPVAGVL